MDLDVTEGDLVWDEPQIRASAGGDPEKLELAILVWLEKCTRTSARLSSEVVGRYEKSCLARLTSIATWSETSLSKPNRAHHRLIARSMVTLFRKSGGSRGLFETVQTLLKAFMDPKSDKQVKSATLYIFGELMKNVGNAILSLLDESLAISLKLARNSSQPIVVRAHALVAIRKALEGTGKACHENTVKDLLKQLRPLLFDRSLTVQYHTAKALRALARNCTLLATPGDLDQALGPALKVLGGPNYKIKKAVAGYIAAVLAATQQERLTKVPVTKSKKDKSGNDEDDDEELAQSSTGAANMKTESILTIESMLHILTREYERPGSTRSSQFGLIMAYRLLLVDLGVKWVEKSTTVLADHLLTEMITTKVNATQWERLATRNWIGDLLYRSIAKGMLTSSRQVDLIQHLIQRYLKNWPKVLPEQKEIGAETLIIALQSLTEIIKGLEGSSLRVLDETIESAKRLLSHPDLAVRLVAATCRRVAVSISPNRLSSESERTFADLETLLEKTANGNGSKEDGYRLHGLSLSLAALLSIMPEQTLYASMETCTRVIGLAAKICKQDYNPTKELTGIRLQVGWNLISGVTTLGPNFCRIHLSQLFILWRAALPKPSLHDQPKAGKTEKDWLDLLVLRECVVTSMLTFLQHNATELINFDNGRRLIALLSNTWALLANYNASASSEEFPNGVLSGTKTQRDLREVESSLKSKLLQCWKYFASDPAMDPLYQNLLNTTLASIADPEKFAGSTAAAAIAATTGTFVDIWHAEDGLVSGLTSLEGPCKRLNRTSDQNDHDFDDPEEIVWTYQPHARAIEFDYAVVWNYNQVELPVSSATGTVDASIQLFALLCNTQSSNAQGHLLEQMLAALSVPKIEKQPARRAAAHFNAMLTIRETIAVANSLSLKISAPVGKLMREILQSGIISNDEHTRPIASQAIALLCKTQGQQFTDQQIQVLIDLVIHNRDSDARAGCARTLGDLVATLGGFSVQKNLPTLINILMSLANDSHPTVHHSALEALSTIITSVSFSFTPYISSTASLLAKIYQAESHEPCAGSIGLSNVFFQIKEYQAFGKALTSLVESLGPELYTVSIKVRNIIRCCLTCLRFEDSQSAKIQALRCIQQLTLLNPYSLDWTVLLDELEGIIATGPVAAAQIAANVLAQLVQRDSNAFTKALRPGLQLRLFGTLGRRPEGTLLKRLILAWLRHTARTGAVFWTISLQRVLSNDPNLSLTTKGNTEKDAGLHDDESAGFAIGSSAEPSLSQGVLPVRVQQFAISCMIDLIKQLAEENAREHFDHRYAAAMRVPSKGLLVSRLSEVIRMAFSAATSADSGVRLSGLRLIRIILKHFSKTADPDFPESLLLEQYQAQIASALTPAFTAESSPPLLAGAIRICGVFIGSGLVQDVTRMGRISSLLTNTLIQSQDPDGLRFGELEVCVTAARTIRLAIASAWAKLHVASLSQDYLKPVVTPHYPILCPLWATALREYAKLKMDPSIMPQGPSQSHGTDLDSLTVAFARHHLLPAYESNWLDILHAYSHLLADRNKFAIDAIVEPDAGLHNGHATTHSKEVRQMSPVPMFHGLFGMSFELLCTALAEQSADVETSARIGLITMRALLRPELAGEEILDPEIASEFVNITLRMIVSQGCTVHLEVVKLLLSLVELYGKRLNASIRMGRSLSHDFFRLLINVVKEAMSTTTPGSHLRPMRETVLTLTLAFDCMTRIAGLFAGDTQAQYAAVALRLYSEILKTEGPGSESVQLTFPVIKGLCDTLAASNDLTRSIKLLNGFFSSILQNIEDHSSRGTQEAKAVTRNNARAAASFITFSRLPLSRQTLEDYSYALIRLLRGDLEMIKTALQCFNTLMSTREETMSAQVCAAHVLPALVAVILDHCKDQATGPSDASKGIVTKCVSAISSLPTSASPSNAPKAIASTLELLLQLVKVDRSNDNTYTSLVLDEIMKEAHSLPLAFKSATQLLPHEVRAELQLAMQERLAGQRALETQSTANSRIQLKAF